MEYNITKFEYSKTEGLLSYSDCSIEKKYFI